MNLIHSLTFRSSVYYAALFCIPFSIILLIFYAVFVLAEKDEIKDDLQTEAVELTRIYQTGGITALGDALADRRHTEAERFPFDTLIDAQGVVVASNLPSWPSRHSPGWLRIEADLHLDGQEEDREALVLDHTMPDGTRLLIGENIEDLDDIEEEIKIAALTFLPVTAALAIIGGALVGRSVGRRIAALDVAAQKIMGSNLSERIPLAGTNDDLDRLAETLNHMLARVEVAVEGLRRTSDSVAHELRTPLARLRLHLEDMLKSPPSQHDIMQTLGEVEALGQMFNAVLAITRLESGSSALELKSVNMSEILLDAAELYAGSADDRRLQFSIDVPDNLVVRGSADLLFQATCNLLDNAIKYTQPTGSVSVTARSDDRDIIVTVSDTGPGIPEELHGLVFQRFYRAPSTSGHTGLGMGLAFVAAVNSVHGARIELHSTREGLQVKWCIPGDTASRRNIAAVTDASR